MKPSWFIATIVMATVLSVGEIVLAQPTGLKVFESKEDGFKITLPGDWVEMPNEVLRELFNAVPKYTPATTEPRIKHLYQHNAKKREIDYPYVAVNVYSKGWINEKQIGKFYEGLDESLKNCSAKATNLFNGVSNATGPYDSRRHMLEIKSRFDTPTKGVIDSYSAVFLTSKGTISFVCCAPEADTNTLDIIFKPAIDSVQLSPELAYDVPHPPGIDFKLIAACLVLSCIIWVGIRPFFRGRKQAVATGQT